ncbi:MAG TPA: T9SS type A sorting domain-containing protein, partial [Chitinophagales bacterium]|nr:T9SS type A sorting domain-containing protein [Chitinophagales bacterium]
GNDLLCNVSSVSTYDIGTAATVAANVGSVNNISKTGTNINGTNCFDPNPTWGGVCAASFNNDNDYGVWYKLPAATNRKDILIKGVTTGSGDLTDLQYALYEASAPTNCLNPGATLISGSYYGSLAWNSVAGFCASADEDHIYTCLDPAKDYYLMVDGNDQAISCGTGNFTLNTYYPREGGVLPCSAEPLPGVFPTWTAGTHKINLAANFCGTPGGHAGAPTAPWTYEKPVWWKFVAPPSGSVEIRMKSDSTNLGDEIRPRLWVFKENTPGTCSNTLLNTTDLDQKDPDDIIGIGDPDLLTEILDVRCLTPGQTYYLVTDGFNTIAEVCGAGTKVGFFSLEIKDLGQAKRDNDNICGATPGRVAGNPYYFTPTADWKTVNKEAELTKSDQDNYCFVIENEPDASDPTWGGAWSTSNNARGGWYSFRAPPSGKVEIELENKSFTADQIDAQIAVYRIKNGNTCDQVQTYTPASGTSSLLEFYGSSNDTYAGVLADEDLTVSCLMPDSLYYIYFEGVNSNTLGVNDLATGQFHLTVRSYPQDPPAKNDNKCNPIYLGKPANATLGSGNPGYINASSSANFNRNLSGSTGTPPTLGGNGVTLVKATNNHGATIPGESTLSCSPNPGCIDGLSEDYDRNLYPFNNFCATAVGDSVPSTWGGFAGAGDKQPRKTVWFMFQAPSDLDGDGNEAVLIELNQETIAINAHKDGMDLRVAVYESSDNTCNGNFYELNSDYDQGNYDEDVKVTCLEPDRYYWIMVDGSSFFSGSDEGYFGMKISRVAPDPRPSNDYICNAHTFSNSFFTGAAVGRTRDTNICARITRTNIDPTPENDPSGFDLDHTVWYKFTAPTTGVPPTGAFAVQVDVNGWGPGLFGYSDKMDPQIAIFESQDGTCNWGTNGTNMVEIASEYDILPFTESMKAYCIIPGKTYYVMVDGSALNSQGYFDISINDIAPITLPTNDDLVNATALTFPSNIGAGNTTTSALAHNYCTDIEPGELDAWTLYDIDNTVWWKFQVPDSGAYTNQHVDLQIRLRSDPGNTKNDKINLLGAVYHQIGGTGGSPGTYPNINENIGTGTNIAIFDEDINLTCLKPGDWYFLQIDGYSGPFNIFRAQGQGWYDVQLEVTGLTPNQGNDSVCGAIVIPVNNIAQPTSGAPYNNICKTTQANETLPWINADSKTVWFKFIPPASGNINIQVQSEASDDIDAQIAVYQSLIPVASSACPPVDQLILAGKDYDALAWGEDMNIKCLDNQYWHYLQVNSANVGLVREGKFKVKIQDIGGTTNPPYNDNICNARDFGNITNANGTGAFNIVGDSNKCATIQLNEPSTISNPTSDIQKSVWYKFTAPTSGRAKITLHDQDGFLSGIDPEMKLYEGTLSGCPSASPTFTNFTVLESAYNPLPNFPTATTGDEVIEYECFIPGQIYYIQVDGTTVGGPQGFFDIKIEDMIPNYPSSPKKPVNDEPTLATTLTVNQQQCPVPIGITSEGDELQGNGTWLTGNYKKPTITKKDLIGTCNTLDNCGDIWYKFTMPNDDCMLGSVVAIQGYSDRAPNVGDQYYNDLKIIAYRGTPGSLVPIECGKVDGNFATNDYFHFEVTGTPGETIYLQVFDQNYNDTDNDDEEDFFICVGKRFGTDKCQSLSNVPFMEYSKDYCWNIEGASGETPASAYGETNSATNPTENSAYFKFKMTSNPCDSLNFTIWQPAPPNLFLQGGGTNLNQIVSLSVYREDNALCDGTIDGALISKTYICSSPTAILDNTLRFNVGLSNLDTNKTYVVQIDGQGQAESGYINDGFIRIDTFQRCVNVQAVTYDDTSTGYWKCVDGWRYYHDRNNVIIFALYPNGNNFDGIAKIRYKSNYDEASICSIPMAEYSMRRIWDFHMTSGSINPLNPVKVRFYYIATEKQAIINAALAFQGSCGGYYEPFEWFKTANGVQYIPTNPAQINPGIINAAYSETACLGSSLFGSPNGCNTLTALDNQYACNGTLYVELGAITGFSGGTGAAGVGPWQNASPLPVELISFTGYNDGAKNVLNWSTASERNTLKFEVERASSNIGQFTYIGELPAAGNSSQPLAYTLDDNRPNIGENYYRLKMIDRDGSFKYSHTILIRNEEVITSNAINGIYPNPTSHLINIDYQSVNSGNAVLKIVNVIGQEISSTVQAIVKGKQIIQIDVSSLADGVYILNIQDSQNGKVLQSKFVKD